MIDTPRSMMATMPTTTNTMKKSPNQKAQRITTTQTSIKNEQQKILVISNPHTIVDPGTMMVHFDNASVADGAVVGAGWFEGLAAAAHAATAGW
mmetsp:Transcript_32596/g.42095  ORF Transcript_32596/g.42095 Transcript_32596/m.42095 type:complete len:94 (-) Transcript_32596:47-328(-)